MRFKRHAELKKGKLDLIPLVDVVLLLLIFFMLTSHFMFPPGIRIDLPKAMTSKAIHEQTLVLTVTSENVLYLNDEPITLKELELLLKKSRLPNENRSLLIKADRKASLGRIVQIWDIAKKAEFEYINIATTEPRL